MVLITGARGFIGRHLANRMVSQGRKVIGIGHGEWGAGDAADPGLTAWNNADVSMAGLDRMQKECGTPDTIFHLAGGASVGAAISDPSEDFSRTVVSTSILLEWIRTRAPQARLVAVSSAAVYGAGHDGRIREDVSLKPFSPYGAHKLMMEILCQSYASNFNLQVVIPRLFSVYGTGLRKQLLWDLCNKLATPGSIELGGSGDELRDWTHVDDVVIGLERAADMASIRAPVFNLATGVGTPVHDIATKVGACWDKAKGPQRIVFSGKVRAGDPFSLIADTDLSQSRKITCERSVDVGIAEYVSWFRSQFDSG